MARQAVSAAAVAAALFVAAAMWLPLADAHAVLIDPQSRPWLDYLERYNYNPHAVFAGGVKSYSDNEQLRWPKHNMNGICGDAKNEYKWDNPGRITKTYKEGQTINVDVMFAQNHLGRMNVRVCPLDSKDEGKCTTLQRTDNRGKDFDLPWTNGWWGVTDGFTPPVNTDGFQTYKMPPVGKGEGCVAWSCDQFKGMYVYRTFWQLPRGFTCNHCKMQFYYLTGSRCWPPCNKANKNDCKKPVPFGYCGEPGQSYPEEFWNCADIKVERSNSGRKLAGSGEGARPDFFPELRA